MASNIQNIPGSGQRIADEKIIPPHDYWGFLWLACRKLVARQIDIAEEKTLAVLPTTAGQPIRLPQGNVGLLFGNSCCVETQHGGEGLYQLQPTVL